MTFKESIPKAKTLAEQALAKGFDVEAFLVLCEINKLQEDVVPESNIDEGINGLLELFVSYYNSKSISTLEQLLNGLHQIVSELYHLCDNNEQKLKVKSFIQSLDNIK